MSVSAPSRPRTDPTVPGPAARWVRGVFVANLVAQVGIIVTGGVVRLTGSGLGCPTWPECVEGSYVPTARQAEEWHKYVEFGNRLLTFVLGVLAIAAVVAALVDAARRRAAGRPSRRAVLALAFVPLVGTLAQAVLGGITVLTGLNPVTVASHFLLSMVIVAGCVLLVVRSGEGGDHPVVPVVRTEVRWLSRALVAVAAVVVVMGTVVTGAGPHSGDADTEARFPIDPRTAAWLHADVVLLFLGLLVGMVLALYLVDAPRRSVRLAWIVVAVALAQGAIGYLQYFTGLPWVAVALHMLGAALLWVSVLWLHLSLRRRGPESPAVPAVDQHTA